MRSLATIEGSDLGVGIPLERLVQVIDQLVIPSLGRPASALITPSSRSREALDLEVSCSSDCARSPSFIRLHQSRR